MSNFNQDLQRVEVDIEVAKEQLALFEAFNRLKDNKDFELLIAENYLVQEAQRACGAKAEIGMIMNEPAMVMLDNIITGVGALRQYFQKIQIEGRSAAEGIAEDIATRDEILLEQAAE